MSKYCPSKTSQAPSKNPAGPQSQSRASRALRRHNFHMHSPHLWISGCIQTLHYIPRTPGHHSPVLKKKKKASSRERILDRKAYLTVSLSCPDLRVFPFQHTVHPCCSRCGPIPHSDLGLTSFAPAIVRSRQIDVGKGAQAKQHQIQLQPH